MTNYGFPWNWTTIRKKGNYNFCMWYQTFFKVDESKLTICMAQNCAPHHFSYVKCFHIAAAKWILQKSFKTIECPRVFMIHVIKTLTNKKTCSFPNIIIIDCHSDANALNLHTEKYERVLEQLAFEMDSLYGALWVFDAIERKWFLYNVIGSEIPRNLEFVLEVLQPDLMVPKKRMF